ncbi:hypothetical protein A2V61_01780 [Candidatus Woesebacteria bacterium RBG_19FT_COMBO_47_8]|uniref:Integral membrane protein n=1 Tax=Candidatus Woesebacteria bacterium RBG_13_46_13 TaxID=1802479 RepID=A0A1F7X5A8_9BACT|nr:MAG: hypothetical protein A2Y68_01845 [Candidatus Woesebacteria bacterium RBG_13_46_13]OGM17111.1 MAG: hypothetical protein A2V61_01780 [Candidatus Woesebacteria bacterium RBG_19FT_COMBO_47_8]HJX59325.1 hypothetical protein [Patescibacteria group bacterium]
MQLAQEINNPALGPALQGKSGAGFFQAFIPSLVGIAFVIGTLVFFFVMLAGAIQWITSGGDKAGLEGARGKIVNALVGFIVLLATFALLKVIEDFFGINILTLDIGPLQIQ